MFFEGRGGGTGNPWISVHAGPQGAHPMIFHVSQEVWDYVTEHGLDLVYKRRTMQARLNAIQALLDSPPVEAAVATAQRTVSTAASTRTLTPLGWVLAGAALVGTGVGVAVRRRRAASALSSARERRERTGPAPSSRTTTSEEPAGPTSASEPTV